MSTERVFFGGHSLGGIVLESYISGHAELAQVNFYVIQSILTSSSAQRCPLDFKTLKKISKFEDKKFDLENSDLKKSNYYIHVILGYPWVPEYIGQFGRAVSPA